MTLTPPLALSVVIPVYGCTPALKELYERLTHVLNGLVESYEIVFIDDRGPDDPWPILTQLWAANCHNSRPKGVQRRVCGCYGL
jgi:hypothetical protein